MINHISTNPIQGKISCQKSLERRLFWTRKKMEPVHTAQAFINGRWIHLARDNKPLTFDTEDEQRGWLKGARKKLRELQNGGPND